MPCPFTISHSYVVLVVGMARAFAMVRPSLKVSPSSTQLRSRMLSMSELTSITPVIVDMPSISGFS